MTDYLAIDALIKGIINSNPATKQNLGRRFAAHLGLNPGKPGPDGGIDGYGLIEGRKIYFQSKLSKDLLGPDFADSLYANLKIHQSEIGIMLAGVGYTQKFRQRLSGFGDIEQFSIYLLTLQDVFGETPAFESAATNLPPLRDLSGGGWQKLIDTNSQK